MSPGGGGVGGGTIESGINLSRDLIKGDKAAWRAVSHPYSLIPNFDDKEALKQLPDNGGSSWPVYSQAAQMWGAPFVMAVCNERAVSYTHLTLPTKA